MLETVQCNILALNFMHAHVHVHMHDTNRHSAQLAVCKYSLDHHAKSACWTYPSNGCDA